MSEKLDLALENDRLGLPDDMNSGNQQLPVERTLGGKTPWEFACEWYTPGEIAWSIARAKNGFGGFVIEDAKKIPADVYSQEFAEWLTNQYRLAMTKGIEIGLRSQTNTNG